jgi:hypothetical protein
MTPAASEFVALVRGDHTSARIRAAIQGTASSINLYCDTCWHDRPHTIQRGPYWTKIQCDGCKTAQQWRLDVRK